MGIIDSVGGLPGLPGRRPLLPGPRGRLTAVAFAAWCGAVLASVVCSGELVASGTARAAVVFPAMVGVHMLIGLGEAAITAMVIVTVWQAAPELLESEPRDAVPRGSRDGRPTGSAGPRGFWSTG